MNYKDLSGLLILPFALMIIAIIYIVNDDADAELAIMTFGLSSVVKGVGKTIEKSVDKLD